MASASLADQVKGARLKPMKTLAWRMTRHAAGLASVTTKGSRFWLLILAFVLFGVSLFNVIDYLLQRERVAFLYATSDNFVLVQTYQDIERLLEALNSYVFEEPGNRVDHDELMLRFELLFSRVPLLSEGEVGKRMSAFPGVIQVAEELRGSLQGIEPLLLKLEPGATSPSQEAIRWELQHHRDALFELSGQFLLSPKRHDAVLLNGGGAPFIYWHFVAVVMSGLLLLVLSLTQLRRDVKISEAFAQERRRWHQAHQELSYQATHDALTGLINRGEVERRLERVFSSAQSQGGEGALLYLDLDRFKTVNDNCGHLAGDQLLRQIATLLRGRVRKRDTLARLGGDEFVVLLEHCPMPKALRVAEDILKVVREFRFVWEEKTFTVGVSIGVAPLTIGSQSPVTVLTSADKACYAAKNAGCNCVRIYSDDTPLSKWQDDQALWVKRIQKGLVNNRFQLYSQAINPLAACQPRTHGEYYEIFLRLEDERGRLVLPEAFFATAERYNLMAALDRWVIRRTFHWLGENGKRLDCLGICFINLSVASLTDGRFQDFIKVLLAECKVPPEKVCFEIAEEVAMANLGASIELIGSLRALGCHFALDDFGAGMSAFAYLKLLPVDFIKIDGGLIRDVASNPVDSTLVHAINDIGQVMGKRTIAKFVESKAMLDELRRIGVDFAQGYGIAKPRPLGGWRLPVAVGA
jgi:diguanylate cyclase (GGDEF)-like protein